VEGDTGMNFFVNNIALYLHTLMILKVDVSLTEYAKVTVFYSGKKLYAAGTKSVTLKGNTKPMLADVRIGEDDTFGKSILNNLGLFGEYRMWLV